LKTISIKDTFVHSNPLSLAPSSLLVKRMANYILFKIIAPLITSPLKMPHYHYHLFLTSLINFKALAILPSSIYDEGIIIFAFDKVINGKLLLNVLSDYSNP
jgi:hypothetical protein